MRQPKISDLMVDRKGTKRMRAAVARTKKIKITINIDQDSLEGLKNPGKSESRLDRIERELAKLKKKTAV